MSKFITTKEVVIAAIAALVFAPFGEVALHLLSSAAQFVGRVSTLGITSIENSQYEMAARTLGRPSNAGTMIMLTFCLGLLVMMMTILYAVIAARDIMPANVYLGMRRIASRIYLACAIPLIPVLVVASQSYYALQLGRAFERHAVLAAPFMTEKERLTVLAEFSVVQSKEQYQAVMAKLDKALVTANAPVARP